MTAKRHALSRKSASDSAAQATAVSRRRFLGTGAGAALSLALPSMLLRAETAGARLASPARDAGRSSIRSCIFVYFYGGPSHIDTWDMKPAAPREVRGEFLPIATAAPGIAVCEHLPRLARVAQKWSIIRSMHHPMTNHNAAAVEAMCGRTPLRGDLELLDDDALSFPSYGTVLSYLIPESPIGLPHVALPHVMYNVVQLPGQTAGFLGPSYERFQITDDPNAPQFDVSSLKLPNDVTADRLKVRNKLMSVIDRQAASPPETRGRKSLEEYYGKAFALLRSDAVRHSLDIAKEPAPLRDRYGRNTLGQSMLLARRLVESGVRFVNVNDRIHNGQDANWDSHQSVFPRHRDHLLPPADQALSALLEDLDSRGLLERTLVVAQGEFGRSPRINHSAGRDHWPHVYSVILAGGGVQGGRVLGSSDKIGAYPATDPVSPGDLAATIFTSFGLDPSHEVRDFTGRPWRLAEGRRLTALF
jgi:Protein of unknown function (DUF1501)